MKVAVVTVTSKNKERGGAERFYDGLVAALKAWDIQTDMIGLVGDESNFDRIKESLLNFYDTDLSDYDGVISTKAPSYLIRHKNHICYLVHTMRVFYDMFENEFLCPTPELLEQRKFITMLDTAALHYPRVKKVFTIGNTVSNRLLRYNGLKSEVLHPALAYDNFKPGKYQEYLFLPGRLHRWKRVDLIIQSMKYVRESVRLKIAGVGEDEEKLYALAEKDKRIEFLGRVSDEELVDLYSNALAVPFVPIHEDYGYITLEAFKSEKPVLTCSDSGEPAHFVQDNRSGFVCEPDPRLIAEKIAFLYNNPEKASTMGKNGKESIAGITWDAIAQTLLNALGLLYDRQTV